jgi:general secretion pathway protein A
MGRRLEISGAPAGGEIFSESAIAAVFHYSRGIPRLVNTICENALLSGYAKQAATITQEIIDDVARDLRLGVVAMEPRNYGGAQLSKEKEQNDLLLAVKTLLEVRDRMQQAETKGRLQ